MGDEPKVDTKKHPTEIDREIGRRMKARRAELGLNQQMLAQQIGVSYQQVQKYENGTDRVGARRLYAIANALRCEIGEFFDPYPAHLRESGAAYEVGLDAQRLLATDDGRALVRAFLSIDDTAVRRKFVELAGALADGVRRPSFVRRVRRPSSRGGA
ncbi:helix-turn-helix transcriptional regulator [Salinarimonas sp.]|uniref:helix-turn-helix domain-containing protein n=1 Tax=Salinarimonas sp. TaxID=2766526 RepID=UPI0032D96661